MTVMPNPFLVAGPNGAGKTTYVRRFLPQEMRCREFVNADLIAAGLSPFAPDQAAFEAGRIMLRRLRDLAAQRVDFSFETTLSGKTYAPLLRKWRTEGYRIRLDFLWIPDLGITRQRVRQRVSKGGHNIPEEVQMRRFHLGIRNLAEFYRPLVNEWRLYDNTGHRPHLVAQERDGMLTLADAPRLAFIEESAKVGFMAAPEYKLEEPAAMTFEEETRRSMRAMRKAFADVVLENKAYGLPVIQWRQDRGVVEVPAEQLEPLARRILEVDGDPLPEAEEQALLAHVKV
jgi:predicted ABC-type ATPase